MDGRESRLPFFLASADWQESYRVFADMMTALGARTSVQDIGGYGTFEGVLLDDLRRPRIEGTFDTKRMRAWDVEWGSARGRAVIENNYADIREAVIRAGRLDDRSRRPLFARISTEGWRGGDQRPGADRPAADRRSAACLRAR